MQEIQNKIKELLTVSVEVPYEDPDWIQKKDRQREAQQTLINQLKKLAKDNNTLLGRIIRFPMGDGESLYLITRIQKTKATVQWIPWIDNWIDDRLSSSGTLPLDYVQEKVNWEDNLDKIFEYSHGNIVGFLEAYGVKVAKDEDPAITELMMNTGNVCIKYRGQEYYINKNNSFYTERDENILKHIREFYSL